MRRLSYLAILLLCLAAPGHAQSATDTASATIVRVENRGLCYLTLVVSRTDGVRERLVRVEPGQARRVRLHFAATDLVAAEAITSRCPEADRVTFAPARPAPQITYIITPTLAASYLLTVAPDATSTP